ncbi:MAG: hypothetical protein R3B40_09715 [Polyangiales bacterium]|nr:hypothetical protein [Sandaracinaceae bacterium]
MSLLSTIRLQIVENTRERVERVLPDDEDYDMGRDDALLNLWMGDQSEEERAYYALRLNAPEVARPLLEAYELAPTILGGNRSRPSGRN